MALPVRKGYTGNGVQSSLTSSPTDTDTTFTVAAKTGWPTTFPFFVVVDPGTSKEEKMRVTAISTLTLTVVRGADNTTAVAHVSGASIYPVFTASEADEANQVASIMTTKGDLIATDGSAINRLAVGATNTHVLQVDSTATNGFKWGQVATAGIADDAVTTAKIAPNTIVQGDVATALLKLVCPVGTISAYPGATAPTGWLLCTGVSTTGYTELIALVGATTPDLQGKVLVGKGSAPFNGALLTSFGSTTSTAAHTHDLGSHTHDFPHQHGGTTGNNNTSHTHQYVRTGQDTVLVVNAADAAADAKDNSFGEATGNESLPHTHHFTTDINYPTSTLTEGPSTNTSGASSVSATHGNVQPSTIINYIIKHDYA